ncbi:ubiquitin-conjugating enzyme [Ceratocystis lukuohia]|uniref:Ubiquitin-conjugating enzyme E2 pex4 n=2 Tax=Ceratocystis TaxID=5157 RepID=A0A2C5WVW5_9PEZI|nr:Ubiquitin-conjugating enzyme E2 pex4 [Ceratocystis fimbriata CBS 114723]
MAGRGALKFAKRLMKEIEALRSEDLNGAGIERLGPKSDDDLSNWEAVLSGRGVGHGYDDETRRKSSWKLTWNLIPAPGTEGRWLLSIEVPSQYPLQPPKVTFITQIVHPNVAIPSGEICLDLLKDAWTPQYTLVEVIKAIRMLLADPGTDSPLNVDVAALIREGDAVAARGLVRLWCRQPEGYYSGP